MFMRYRGGSIGHLYMRTVEAWLAKTGWGADDILMPEPSDSDDSEATDPGLENKKDNSNAGSEDEVSDEGRTSSNHTTDTDDSLNNDPDTLYAIDEDNEETLEGEYGFSGL